MADRLEAGGQHGGGEGRRPGDGGRGGRPGVGRLAHLDANHARHGRQDRQDPGSVGAWELSSVQREHAVLDRDGPAAHLELALEDGARVAGQVGIVGRGGGAHGGHRAE